MVREVPLQCPPKLRALFRNRVMPVTMQLLLEFAQCGLHPIATRHTLKCKRAVPRAATDVREPKEVERLRFAKSSLGTPLCRVSPELDQAGLLRMHS
jgi:hypothetical protein